MVKLKGTQSIPGALHSTCLPFVHAHNSSLIRFTRSCLVISYATITVDIEALITPAEKIEKYNCYKWACNLRLTAQSWLKMG